MQDLLNLVSKQRKVASGRHSSASAATDPYALSDPFLDMYDELVDMGYSPAAFERWLELAASEASPGTAYEAIATYMLFQPQDTAVYPLNLSAALDLLERAGTASAKVLQTIVRMAVFQNQIASAASTADALLRTHAAANFLARMVLAARLYSHAAAPLTDDDPCEEAVAYYYTSAEDSVQDMIDSGGEKENYEPMLRLSEAWMGMHRSSDDLLEVPLNGMDALDYVRSLALGWVIEWIQGMCAGLGPNPIEALRHFEEAAANGIAHSMANLGLMYANGMGVDPNPERAVQYFQQAADQGNAFAVNGLGYIDSRQAHLNLGIMYYKGLGTPRSCPLAVQAFRTVAWRAALFDDVLLSPELGHKAFLRGDMARSLLHYSIWALFGVPQAACNAGFLLDQMHTQPFDTTPPLQLAKALYEAAGSDPEALRKLGHCHRDGWDHACSANATIALEYAWKKFACGFWSGPCVE
ncbi:hypothetical protein DYB32_007145 [Aphanomyces invadans]|uniref:Uncharacterized protein n=1 Tax=Aphanomyces invadans TaxID=157072 RepID=A0A3R6Y535_9STRA|nr:hypothetical protein DYB32_007145 [Aphanomyces invadans]